MVNEKIGKYLIPGYVANNGYVFTLFDCKRYNALQQEINAFILARMPVRDGALDNKCLMYKIITNQI